MYHGEDAEEDFLVLAGECLLLSRGRSVGCRAWDFVHCPPWTEHIFVGAGTARASSSRSARAARVGGSATR